MSHNTEVIVILSLMVVVFVFAVACVIRVQNDFRKRISGDASAPDCKKAEAADVPWWPH